MIPRRVFQVWMGSEFPYLDRCKEIEDSLIGSSISYSFIRLEISPKLDTLYKVVKYVDEYKFSLIKDGGWIFDCDFKLRGNLVDLVESYRGDIAVSMYNRVYEIGALGVSSEIMREFNSFRVKERIVEIGTAWNIFCSLKRYEAIPASYFYSRQGMYLGLEEMKDWSNESFHTRFKV